MLEYRLYLLDTQGHVAGAVEMAAPSDDEALARVEEHAAPGGLELWQLGRLVRRFPNRRQAAGER